FVPSAWAVHRLGAPLFHWSPDTAMEWFSALCGAAACAWIAGTLLRRGVRTAAALATVLLVAATPGAGFFSTTAEVRGRQSLGAAIATDLALRAGDAPPRRARTLLLASLLLAPVFHVVNVLLLPLLVLLALQRPERSRGGGDGGAGVELRSLPLLL